MKWKLYYLLLYSDHQQSYCFFSIQVKLMSRGHCMKKPKSGFSDTYFPAYRQNRIRISQSIDRIYDIRENADTVLSIYGKIRTTENPYIDIFLPVRYGNNLSYVYFNLTLNWVMYIYVLYFDLANFSSLYRI